MDYHHMNNKDDDSTIDGGMTTAAIDKQPNTVSVEAGLPKNKRLCKALQCPKFKQGKCNGYCVECFQKFGATTCRDPNCIDKIHKDGYCESHHLAIVVDDTTAKKPAPEKAKKKIAVAESKPEPSKRQPVKSAKRKRRHRERITFPKTSAHKALRIEANAKNPKHQTITKRDLLSLVNSVLQDTRHAKSANGKIHYLLDEIRDNMNKALESSSSSGHKGKEEEQIDDNAPVEIQGISEEAFTTDEIALMPVVFAYHCEDPESEQIAKIATLDYEVEQNRLKRLTAMGESNSSSGQAPSKTKEASPQAEDVSSMGEETERVPADEFPTGWTMQNVPRKNRTSNRPFDTYYYSPKLQLKFRSRPEVKRFIALLESSDNDEMKAQSKFKPR